MLRLVITQLAMTLFAAVIAGLLGDYSVLFSVLLGGFCNVVPNSLFALSLFISARWSGGLKPTSFIFGEVIKIAVTVALLGAVIWLYRELNWLAFIAAFIIASKSYIILLFRH